MSIYDSAELDAFARTFMPPTSCVGCSGACVCERFGEPDLSSVVKLWENPVWRDGGTLVARLFRDSDLAECYSAVRVCLQVSNARGVFVVFLPDTRKYGDDNGPAALLVHEAPSYRNPDYGLTSVSQWLQFQAPSPESRLAARLRFIEPEIAARVAALAMGDSPNLPVVAHDNWRSIERQTIRAFCHIRANLLSGRVIEGAVFSFDRYYDDFHPDGADFFVRVPKRRVALARVVATLASLHGPSLVSSVLFYDLMVLELSLRLNVDGKVVSPYYIL